MSVRIPKYRLHKPIGQALFEIRGKRIHLGKHGTTASEEKYNRTTAQLVSTDELACPIAGDTTLTISMLILHFFCYPASYYVKNGKPTDEIAAPRAILWRLRKLHGISPAADKGRREFSSIEERCNSGFS